MGSVLITENTESYESNQPWVSNASDGVCVSVCVRKMSRREEEGATQEGMYVTQCNQPAFESH